MRFHAILLVRDEADILPEFLDHTLSWASTLAVFDNGSTDGSWEMIVERAARDSRIIAWKRRATPYKDGLRAHVFRHVRSGYRRGDWISCADADEIYHVAPPAFVAAHAKRADCVLARLHDFILTDSEMLAILDGREDPTRPIQARRRHYQVNPSREIRLFRYRPTIRWPAWRKSPLGLVRPADEPIAIRHYKWRSPEQAIRRWALRYALMPVRHAGGTHWNLPDWRTRGLRPDGHPRVRCWLEGGALDSTDPPRRAAADRDMPRASALWRVPWVREIADLLRPPARVGRLWPLSPEIERRARELYDEAIAAGMDRVPPRDEPPLAPAA